MQYILTEKEYTDLVSAPDKIREENKLVIFQLCREVCNNKPLLGWHNEVDGVASPWGCCCDEDGEYEHNEWYCDNCPVQKQCPASNYYSQ